MTESAFTLDSISLKVQKLLAKANDPAVTPAEAQAFAAKAQALMDKYRVEAAEDIKAGGQKPEWDTVFVGNFGEWSSYLYSLVTRVASANGIRIKVEHRGGETPGYYGIVCGFAHDVRFFTLTYTSIMEAFLARLEPRFNPDESAEANALRLREGGMERKRIAVALGMLSPDALRVSFYGPRFDQNVLKAATRKVTGLIKRRAEQLGDPNLANEVLGRGFNAKTYRQSYADGFYATMTHRLRMLALDSKEAGLVLASAKERVDEVWYERFPEQRPVKTDGAPYVYTPCAKCAKAKSGKCRDHSVRKAPERPFNERAALRGQDAARSVDLAGGGRKRL